MIIGIPKEIKNGEYRVGVTPTGVRELLKNKKNSVLIEKGAGVSAGFSDKDYREAGAKMVDVKSVWEKSDMIMKVKEPLKSEFKYFRKNLIIYSYMHLAANVTLAKEMMEKGVVSIAYENITEPGGGTPGNRPMSEFAGRLAIQTGMWFLTKAAGGSGTLLSGIPGVPRGRVLIVGGGDVGKGAVKLAVGVGAKVTVVDKWIPTLKAIEDVYGSSVRTEMAFEDNIATLIKDADLVVGALAVRGDATPKLISRKMVKSMKPGSVIVDVAIDQGGCSETSRLTTHEDPIYVEEGVIHYCVPNMPGTVARSSTIGLTNTTIRYAIDIAKKGWEKAIKEDPYLRDGVNTAKGHYTLAPVAKICKGKYVDPATLV